MSASLDELRALFNRWKNVGNTLAIEFSQEGHTRLSTRAWVKDVSEDEVTFSYGLVIAGGELSFRFSTDAFSARIVDPQKPPPTLEHWDTGFETCVEFSWMSLRDRCVICALPKA